MKKKDLQDLAQAATKNIKTEEDLNQFRQILTKITVEAALNGVSFNENPIFYQAQK